jgi:hypothetical protein
MKTRSVLTLLVLILAAMTLPAVAGCGSATETQHGKLTGFEASIDYGGISDQFPELNLSGRLVITKDNGREIHAYFPEDMADSLKGGQILEVKKIEDTDEWMVTRILEEPQ